MSEARADSSRIAGAVQRQLGLPERFRLLGPGGFPAAMNQTDSRLFIDDRELFYLENYIRIGNGRIRALWDVGTPLFTATKPIASFFWYNLGFTYYCAIFYKDGTADQITTAGASSPITTVAGTFYHGSGTPLPACCQSGTGKLLIANNNTPNDYWIWDGNALFGAGGVAPDPTVTASGQGYTSPPTITLQTTGPGTGVSLSSLVDPDGTLALVTVDNPGAGFGPTDFVIANVSGGGSDTQAVATANLSAGGGVTGVVVTNPGSGYTFATSLSFSGGSGSGATAVANIQNGQIISVTMTNAGTGYTSPPTVIATDPGYGTGSQQINGGSGAAGYATIGANGIGSIVMVTGGSGYTSVPAVEIVGDGTGATAVAAIAGGAVTGINVTNPGQGYTKALVKITGGNNAANVDFGLMPFGISGTALETMNGRVFIGPPSLAGRLTNQSNQGAFFVSAPASLTDFATSDGGLLFTTTDRFLRASYTNFRQSNGYLYPFGDSSISVISNIQTTGSPLATTFSYQNIDPLVGSRWRDTCADFSRTILFANPFGVYGLYGGAVTPVSGKMDRVFQNAIFPTTPYPTDGQPTFPSSAVANIFTERCYCLLMQIKSILTGQPRDHILIYNEHDWQLARLDTPLTYIGTREIASDITAWGTDGHALYQLFARPSNMQKSLATKLYGADQMLMTKQMMGIYLMGQDFSGQGMSFSITQETESGGWTVPPEQGFKSWSDYMADNAGVPPPVPASPDAPLLAARGLDVVGQVLGLSLFSTAPDFEIYGLQFGSQDVGAVFG